MRVAIYIRVSTDEQANEGYSIRAQRQNLVDYCRVNEYTVSDVYIDDGYSAKDTKRPRLQALLADAKNGLFDTVLVYKLDRFTRSVKDLYELLEYLQSCKVDFISRQEKFDTTTAIGRAMIGILGVFAQFERELIAERVRFGMEQKVREGKKPGGKYSYGYDKQGEKIEEEHEIMRYVRSLYMEHNLGFKSAAHRLLIEGITRRGFPWTASNIALTLENPFNAGIIQFGEKMANGKYPQRKREERVNVIKVMGTHEPVWTIEEYEEHIRLMKSRSVGGYSRKLDYWFTGLLRCGRCGASMYGRLNSNTLADGKKVRRPYYWCSTRKENKGCTMPMVTQRHLEHLLMEHINGIIIDHDLTIEERKKLKKQQDNREKMIKKLRQDLEGIKSRVKKWQYMFVEELVTADDLRTRLDDEYSREAEILKQIEDLLALEKETPEVRSQLISVADLWPVIDDLEKKELLNSIFDEISIYTDAVNPRGTKNKFFDATIKVKYRG